MRLCTPIRCWRHIVVLVPHDSLCPAPTVTATVWVEKVLVMLPLHVNVPAASKMMRDGKVCLPAKPKKVCTPIDHLFWP
jgi:hypothetical protein